VLEFENSDVINVNMSSLKGHIKTTYGQLVKTFGEPTHTDASPYEKVNAEWTLEFTIPFTDEWGEEDFNYVKATIYNWKDGYVPTEEYDWHIGGFDYEAVECVEKVLDSAKELV
jgi:hypothetical protein